MKVWNSSRPGLALEVDSIDAVDVTDEVDSTEEGAARAAPECDTGVLSSDTGVDDGVTLKPRRPLGAGERA